MRADNSAHIITAARRRSDDARRRAVTALRSLDAGGQPVTFSTVASAAGVSRSWLYAQDDLREQIGRLRTRQQQAPSSPPRPGPAAGDARLPAATPGSSHRPHPRPGIREPPAPRRARARARRTSGPRRSAHQPRHARKTESTKIPTGLQRNRREAREQHCPRHKPQVRWPQDRRAKDNQGQVGQRAVVQVGEDLLDDGVAAVLLLGLDQLVRASR